MPKTPDQGRIVVCADDYGADAASDGVILALLGQGALDATTCLVGGPAWRQGAPGLRDLAGAGEIAVGLHLNLTQVWAEGEGGPAFAPIRVQVIRALLPTDPVLEEVALSAFARQWGAFEDAIGRPPDFVDGHEHVHLFPTPRLALFRLCEQKGFTGWLRQCRSSGARWSPKRLVLDPFSAAFARAAAHAGLAVNRGFGGLRRFDPAEDIGQIWRTDLAAMPDGGVLMVHPGAADETRAGECRAQEAALLTSGWMARTLGELGRS
jgi:predicted glycoside hydrolase/deacetylase ChbG (UPF0249 family)